jgi:hypothetical protein
MYECIYCIKAINAKRVAFGHQTFIYYGKHVLRKACAEKGKRMPSFSTRGDVNEIVLRVLRKVKKCVSSTWF